MSFSVSRDEVTLGNYRIGTPISNGRQDPGGGHLWKGQVRHPHRNGRKGRREDPGEVEDSGAGRHVASDS